jgi:hypothetical protein
MSRFLNQTLHGYRDFLEEQRKVDGLCLFTLTKFDTRGLRNPFTDLEISAVPNLNNVIYTPSSGTNLRDAIFNRIAERRKILSEWDIQPRVLFVCMTDGEDNSSCKSILTTRDAIMKASANDWTFVYLGAYPGASKAALELGFPASNIRCFEGDKIYEKMQELSNATTAYRTSTNTNTNFYV